MKNLFKFLLIIFIFFFLNSCSYVSLFFVQNLKNQDLKVLIEFEHLINDKDLKNMPSLFTSNVDKLKDFHKETNRTKLEYELVNERTISVILPKNSISKIDVAVNRKTNITKIFYTDNDKKIELERNTLLKKSKFKSQGILFKIK